MPGNFTLQQATFDQSVTVQWTDGTNFNGYILIGIVPPTGSGTDWAYVTGTEEYPAFRVPTWARVPIQAGKFNSDLAIIRTDNLNPPGVKYIAYYYDSTNRQIAGPSSSFTVTTGIVTPPVLTLTAPTGSGTNPVPN